MVQSKIEIFTAMLAEQPENAMIWYGLASEQYKLRTGLKQPRLGASLPLIKNEYGALLKAARFFLTHLLHHTCLFDEQRRRHYVL